MYFLGEGGQHIRNLFCVLVKINYRMSKHNQIIFQLSMTTTTNVKNMKMKRLKARKKNPKSKLVLCKKLKNFCQAMLLKRLLLANSNFLQIIPMAISSIHSPKKKVERKKTSKKLWKYGTLTSFSQGMVIVFPMKKKKLKSKQLLIMFLQP